MRSCLQAKCLAMQANQIEDLLTAAEDRQGIPNHPNSREKSSSSLGSVASSVDASDPSQPPPARLVFSRGSKPTGWWLWQMLSGGSSDGKVNRRRSTPKGVLHQIAAETPSLAAFSSADLALEIIRRTLGIEEPGHRKQEQKRKSGRSRWDRTAKEDGGARATEAAKTAAAAAPLTWDLLEAAFEPVSGEGAGHESTGLMSRLDPGGMHGHALLVLVRVRALEGRGLEIGIRMPADVSALANSLRQMEATRASALAESKER